MGFRETLREVVEHVRVVANAAQEYEWQSGAAEIEHVNSYSGSHVHSKRPVRCGIRPSIVRDVARTNWSDVAESCGRNARL